MEELSAEDASIKESQKETRYLVAVAWGVLMGCLTLAAQTITVFSANPVIAAIQFALTMLLVPGLVCAAMVGSLGLGAVINGLFHFGVSWLLLALLARFKRKATARQ